jgi:hypothetical protein
MSHHCNGQCWQVSKEEDFAPSNSTGELREKEKDLQKNFVPDYGTRNGSTNMRIRFIIGTERSSRFCGAFGTPLSFRSLRSTVSVLEPVIAS